MAKKNQKTNLSITSDVVEGTPTKEFFISMLIKDITLRDAIGDLIDNAVDAAKKNAKSSDNLKGFWIKVTADKDRFEITDNCGGIPIDIAQNYAFKFGRDKKYKLSPYSIGQFGIGMKRAFFKLGNLISISSIEAKSKFKMHIAVEEWRKKEDWNFSFDTKKIGPNASSKCGTSIVITSLSEDSIANFDLASSFYSSLKDEIQREHLYNLNKGISIFINSKPLHSTNLTLSFNKEFKPGYWHHKFDSGLKVDVYAGVGEDEGNDGGWYIFCNERLITGPNTTADTGWTGSGKDGVALYHDQFYRFRGYVFFECEDASKLPWNTTKTGMNLDSPEYQFVRLEMINMMRPVMSLMNQLKKEKEKNTPESDQALNNKLKKTPLLNLGKIITQKTQLKNAFLYPKLQPKVQKTGEAKISYSKPYKQVDKVRNYFGVTKLSDVGSFTFDYFYKNELGKD